MIQSLPETPASELLREAKYRDVIASIEALLEGEKDWVAAMATVVCELHHSFDYFHWTGFYRVVEPGLLKIGPYQGGHGCLTIPFTKGVCGAAARQAKTQLITDVHQVSDHIACSATTNSEIVVPLITKSGNVVAVLDVDSDLTGAFTKTDQRFLEQICSELVRRFFANEAV